MSESSEAPIINPPNEWVTLGEAAKRVGIKPKALRGWCRRNKIPMILDPDSPRGHYVYDIEAIIKVRESMDYKPNPEKGESNPYTIKIQDLIVKERLDIRQIIRDGLRNMQAGEVAYEERFMKHLSLSRDRFRDVKDEEEFEPYKATLPGRKIVWGPIVSIQNVKELDGVT